MSDSQQTQNENDFDINYFTMLNMIAERLNKLLMDDPKCISQLFLANAPCSTDSFIKGDESILVNRDKLYMYGMISPLFVINNILGDKRTHHRLAMRLYNDPVTKTTKVLNFCVVKKLENG